MSEALHHRISQFYYREARLLDARRLQSWLELLTPDILYEMPVRHNYMGAPEAVHSEAFHAPEREFGSDAEAPFRRDTLATLTMRARRMTHPTVWFDNPPPRTRRFISNIELVADEGGTLTVCSNFLLHFSHHEADNHLYAGARRDILRATEESFLIVRRRVLLDWNLIPVPTLGLIF